VETALEIATGWGIKYIELKGIGTQRVGGLSPYWEDHVTKMLRNFKVEVSAVSTGVF